MSRYAAEPPLLEALDARGKLFDEILEQLAMSGSFSDTALGAPTIFPVYAHRNEAVGTAHDTCVHDLISWLLKIKAGILSDKSALPPLTSYQEDTSPQRNIIANQIRLLPHGDNARSDGTITYIDKVMVCGSKVLERYCEASYALEYIDQIVTICNKHDDMKTLKSQIELFVDQETGKDGHHHVLTEIALLKVRKSRVPDHHGMIPVALDGAHPLRYLSVFGDSDITFKLNSTSAADKHALFFKLLEQLFARCRSLAIDFRNCYDKVVHDLKLGDKVHVSRNDFYNCLSWNMTIMYRTHWSTFSTAMRNGRFNEYAGNLERHVLQILYQNREILHQNREKKRLEILHWVSSMGACPMPGKHQDEHQERVDGTCDWVIEDEEFVRWYEAKTSATISLQGRMGMGKTYATSRVIEWIQQSLGESQQRKALAYFYCVEQDEMHSTAKAIVRSIVRQVATQPREGAPLDEAIHKIWKKHGHNGPHRDSSTLDEWEDCLSKLISKYHGATIVLDALDECKLAERTVLTKLFSSLAERCSNLKIFVSTRPEPDLSKWLDRRPSISMHSGRTSEDVALFVQNKITEHDEWEHIDHELKELVLKTILEKSEGLFLCAHLQIENLRRCSYEQDIRDELIKLPQRLTRLYEELYFLSSPMPAEKKFRDRALRWVLCSARPLTSEELLFAISQDAQTDRITPVLSDVSKRLLLKSCRNFLTLDSSNTNYMSLVGGEERPSDPVWRLAHQAVAEFFENSVRCTEERADLHYEAGKVCLMLSLETFGGSAVEGKQSNDRQCPCQKENHTEKGHSMLTKPLVEYSIHAWPIHVREHEHRECNNNRRLSQMLLRFLNHPKEGCLIYERWLEHVGGVKPYPAWSAVHQRRLDYMTRENNRMSYFNLVCCLGFPQTLDELLNSAGVENATHYNAQNWAPWGFFIDDMSLEHGPLRWSAVALACAYDEAKVLQCLMSSEPLARLDSFDADEVPPIVAAARGDSVEVAHKLLQHDNCISMCSSFTSSHGHILRFALWGESLRVLPLLLDRFPDSPALSEALSSVWRGDFRSTNAISLLLERDVEVDTPLQDGTLLAVAAYMGDQGLVDELLQKGADANTQFQCKEIGEKELRVVTHTGDFVRALTGRREWVIENALEACLCNEEYATHTSVARLLVEGGASPSARAIAMVADQILGEQVEPPELGPQALGEELLRDILPLLMTSMSNPDEICQDRDGLPTCALNEALRVGNVAAVKLLLDRGAVEGTFGNMIQTVFEITLIRQTDDSYPTRQMSELLQEAGANFGNLAFHSLNTVLAGAAWTGSTTLVPILLEHRAYPDVPHDWPFITALGTAAASGRPEAPDIIRLLLDRTDVNLHFPNPSDGSASYTAELALDFPLWLMLDKKTNSKFHASSHVDRLKNWFRSADVLVSNGAVWDVDFAQWRECLKEVEPDFALRMANDLDRMQEGLERNRNKLSVSDKASAEWRIKDPVAPDSRSRVVLASMEEVLRAN